MHNSGLLVFTTASQGGGAVLQTLHIWATMTEGTGALPYPEEFCRQLESAGFIDVKAKKLVPMESFYAYLARKP